MSAGGVKVLAYLADGDGSGGSGRGAVGGGASGTVRLTARRRRIGAPAFRLPLLSLPKRLLLSEAPSATLPERLREGDMMPVRWSAKPAFRVGDLIRAMGFAAMLMLLRRLRMSGRSTIAVGTAVTLLEVPLGVGVMLRPRSTGSMGLDGMVIGEGGTGVVVPG